MSTQVNIKFSAPNSDGEYVTTDNLQKATAVWAFRNDTPKKEWNAAAKKVKAKAEELGFTYSKDLSVPDKRLAFIKPQAMARSIDDFLQMGEDSDDDDDAPF